MSNCNCETCRVPFVRAGVPEFDEPRAEIRRLHAILATPEAVHQNLLRGTIKLTREQALHFACAADYDQLRAENERLKADKARLDWLESQLRGSFLDLCHYEHQSQLDGSAFLQYDPAKPYYVGGSYGHCGETLRAAIDAAITTQAKEVLK